MAAPTRSQSAEEESLAKSPWPPGFLQNPYNPGFWNNVAADQANNNCYNYGLNQKTGTYAQPGRAHGIMLMLRLTCKQVGNAAVADGLVQTDCTKACPNATSAKVALVIDDNVYDPKLGLGMDYHWYRQNSSDGMGNTGYFSHKLRPTPATNPDTTGNLIPTPDRADRRREDATPARNLQPGYSTFCTCYRADAVDGHVVIN